MSKDQGASAVSGGWSRRRVLRTAAGVGVAGAAAAVGSNVLAQGSKLRPLTLAWNANAVCLSAVPVAVERGFFEKQGLKVELVNFAGSTDQLINCLERSRHQQIYKVGSTAFNTTLPMGLLSVSTWRQATRESIHFFLR